MTPTRFSDFPKDEQIPQPPAGFLLIAVPGAVASQGSMQWFYQRLYEEAAKANQPAPMRDLFKVMN